MAEASVDYGEGNFRLWRKQEVVGQAIYQTISGAGCSYLNCYTNLEPEKWRYKHSLIVFYYANREETVFKCVIMNKLRKSFE